MIYGLSGAIDMLVFYPAGKLMDRRGRLFVAVPSTLIMGMAMLLIPLTPVHRAAAGLAADRVWERHQLRVVMTLGADFSPDRGRGQFLGLWRFIADAGSTGGPVLLSGVTAVATLGPGFQPPGFWVLRRPLCSRWCCRG